MPTDTDGQLPVLSSDAVVDLTVVESDGSW